MSVFLAGQLDFILFFYGLAFLLLGLVSFAAARSVRMDGVWVALGLFGLIHGASEWLDLIALIVSDNSTFAVLRAVVMTASFVCMVESARLGLAKLRWSVPGTWIQAPVLLIIVLVGSVGGLADANALSRLTLALTGSAGLTLVLLVHARATTGAERAWAMAAAAGFALYGLAAGGIVPVASFWPANNFNQGTFYSVTGVPIQLVRGLLACGIAFAIWGVWGHRISRQVGSPRYTRYWQLQFLWTSGSLMSILVCGWVLTDYLGQVYSRGVQDEGRGEIELIARLLAGETTSADRMVEALAGSPTVVDLLTTSRSDDARADLVLRTNVKAAEAELGYVLNSAGRVVVSTDPGDQGRDAPDARLFRQAMAGQAGHGFSYNPADGERHYEASYPIRDNRGAVSGVAVIRKSLEPFAASVSQFGRPLFLVDSNGLVMVTNKPGLKLRPFWPLAAEVQGTLVGESPGSSSFAIVSREVTDETWAVVNGKRDYVRRQTVNHGAWSLIILVEPRGIGPSRALGIVITLLTATVILVYLVGRERRVHDAVQSDKRAKLEELARDLDRQATTDPLTGAFNRLKFNQELSVQIARAERYGIPLSLVLFDIDHFKQVNDSFGHLAGDRVLIGISDLTRHQIRSTDLHARWGGEEFVIMATDTTTEMARQLAEHLRTTVENAVFESVGHVTCSFGVVQFETGDTASLLVAKADRMLYRAKASGRNRVEGGAYDNSGRKFVPGRLVAVRTPLRRLGWFMGQISSLDSIIEFHRQIS